MEAGLGKAVLVYICTAGAIPLVKLARERPDLSQAGAKLDCDKICVIGAIMHTGARLGRRQRNDPQGWPTLEGLGQTNLG